MRSVETVRPLFATGSLQLKARFPPATLKGHANLFAQFSFRAGNGAGGPAAGARCVRMAAQQSENADGPASGVGGDSGAAVR